MISLFRFIPSVCTIFLLLLILKIGVGFKTLSCSVIVIVTYNLLKVSLYVSRNVILVNTKIDVEKLSREIEKCGKVELYFKRGLYYFHNQIYNKAVEDFNVVIHSLSQNIRKEIMRTPIYRVFEMRGESYYEMKDFQSSLFDFTSAIEIRRKEGKSLVKSLVNRGITNRCMGNLSEAKNDFSAALLFNPMYYEALNNRGYVYFLEKDFDHAKIDFLDAIEIDETRESAFINLGIVLYETSEYDEALEIFDKALTLNPKNHHALNNRGITNIKLGRLDYAIKDLEGAYNLSPMDFFTLCSLGELEKARGNILLSHNWFKKVIEIHPFNPDTYRNKCETLGEDFHPELVLDDYVRMYRHSFNKVFDWNNDDVKRVVMRLRKSFDVNCYSFQDDDAKNEKFEKKEFRKLRERFEKSVNTLVFEDFVFIRSVGSGSYSRAYVCQIKGFEGVFVVKLCKHPNIESNFRREKILKSDKLNVGYNRNVVQILAQANNQDIDVKELPDYDSFWIHKYTAEENTKFSGGITIMKFYRMDLHNFLEKRRHSSDPITPLEICRILSGILKGAIFLHKNWIVHRDLYEENIFLDELNGRVFIADFGLCLDLSFQKSFLVKSDDNRMIVSTDSSYFNKGGDVYLAPEIMRYKLESSSVVTLDYSYSDIYCIGMMGYKMLAHSKQLYNHNVFPFGSSLKRIENGNGLNVEQKDYVDLKYEIYPPLAKLVKKMLMIDKEKREKLINAEIEIRKMIEDLEQKL